MISFEQLYANRTRSDKRLVLVPLRLVSIDPGSTTGIAVFHLLKLHRYAQLNTSTMEAALAAFTTFFNEEQPTEVVLEDYRVYANRAQQHVGSSLETPRLIGMIETLCFQRTPCIPFHKQPAGTTKQFCTDSKLKAWGMWPQGQRHAADAVRHGAYYILFPPKARTSETISTSKHKGHVG